AKIVYFLFEFSITHKKSLMISDEVIRLLNTVFIFSIALSNAAVHQRFLPGRDLAFKPFMYGADKAA
ncbi:MAG: hypothetical protein U0L58_00280, partial [Ruminococcus sp.]|nr:hypothetical protein [Ruminococcus sp.]